MGRVKSSEVKTREEVDYIRIYILYFILTIQYPALTPLPMHVSLPGLLDPGLSPTSV